MTYNWFNSFARNMKGSGFLICFLLFFVISLWSCKDKEKPVETTEVLTKDTVTIVEPKRYYNIIVDSLEVFESRIRRNQNLADILTPFNISYNTIHQLAIASKKVFDVRKLVSGKDYSILYKNDSVKTGTHFIYRPSPIEYIVYNFSDSIEIYKAEKPVEIEERQLSGIIESSFYETMVESGASPELVDMVVDVFAWQVDFFGIQKGDNYKIIYEEQLVDGQAVGINGITGAYFDHINEPYYAVTYDQGKGIDYFEPNGKSLRRNLLKAPLKFTRISSRYSGRRFHPVQKRYKAHRGTDYAAPIGTPIRTVGDGIVLEAKYQKYNGNYVKIKHNDNISTQYLHMNKIASGIRKGVKVKQGQTIGFVGKTGLANGPHLCYRFWKNGVQVDALKVDLPAANPIVEEHRATFDSLSQIVIKRLDVMPTAKPDSQPEIASLQTEG
ncbi:MAG: peptidoglycan DD-metalloendopeptidase family protein [Cyclobacteriaceae bacterium]